MMSPGKTKRITWLMLGLGLGSALVIFLTADPEVEDPLLGDRFGQKKYLREMRTLGGQGNVVAAEFNEWFAGLWEGRALAGTVAVITVGAVLVFRFVATHPEAPVEENDVGRDR
jgi:hypothetical protein